MSERHVDVLVPTVGRDTLQRALDSAPASLLGDDVVLHVHVVEDPDRRGPAWARNRAAERGSAPYIALLDDDDRWLPGRFRLALDVLDARPHVAVVCGEALPAEGGLFLAKDPRGSGRPEEITPGDHPHEDLVLDCFVAASTATLRRADWESVGGMDEDLRQAEDYALWLRLTHDGRFVHVLPDSLARLGPADLSARPGAAAGTLAALERYARAVPDARRGPLLAVMAFEARKDGRSAEARALARQALAAAPRAALTWKAALRALV